VRKFEDVWEQDAGEYILSIEIGSARRLQKIA
jgi:hypothetical protein